jgi:hypothetical protein
MKNIHIIPTDKPSSLMIEDGKLLYSKNFGFNEFNETKNFRHINKQHIYITSDEEIKEGDWQLSNDKHITIRTNSFHESDKKIILTTDQDLIKDGVQAIDDEFLEWFVKNASCEEVEVEKGYLGMCGFVKSSEPISKDKLHYKIIIPQEEPKYVSSGGAKYVFGTAKGEFALSMGYNPETTNSAEGHHSIVIGNGLTSTEHKQETLEEFIKSQPYYGYCTTEYKEGIEVGAKWQAERMYSEEEVYDILIKHTEDLLAGKRILLNEWFEQFKKK